MSETPRKFVPRGIFTAAAVMLLAAGCTLPAFGDKKKDQAPAKPPDGPPKIDISNIVWPQPPAIARVRYLD
jgi:hypothetical protein